MPDTEESAVLRLSQRVAPRLDAVREAARRLRVFLSQHGVDAEDAGAAELLVAEAGNNAVLYAPETRRHEPCRITALLLADRIELEIEDHSQGFDFPENPELPDPLAEHGRGLYLIRTLADAVGYRHGRSSNVLSVVRRRRTPGAAAAGDPGTDAAMLDAMTEELASCYESLSAVFQFTAELSREHTDSRWIGRWLDHLQSVCGGHWWSLRLAGPVPGELVSAGTSLPMVLSPLRLEGPPEESVERQALIRRQDIWLDPATEPSDLEPLRSLGVPLRGLVHPIFASGNPVGVLTVGSFTTGQPFTAAQVNIIQTIGDFLGLQVHNARIQEERIADRLIRKEVEIAATIQRSLLPERLPSPDGFELAGCCEMASQVGGDYYDVLDLPGQGILCVLADVMGKGLPASLFAAILRSTMRSRPELASDPGAFLEWLNGALFADLDRVQMFLTAQLVFLDPSRRELHVASAGHCPLLIGGRDLPVHEVAADGPPLGIAPDLRWTSQRLPLPEGARLVMYTDGLIESRGPSGQFLGLDPVRDAVRAAIASDQPAADLCQDLVRMARRHQGGTGLSDDLTLLLLAERNPPPFNPTPHGADNPDR